MEKSQMRNYFLILKIVVIILLFIGTSGFSSDKDLPTLKGKKIIAMVNKEPITFDELNRELISLPNSEKGRVSELLRRLVNTKLIIQEARRMGLDELKEIKNMIDVFSKITLREELMEKITRDIKVSEKEVEKFYKNLIKEYKVSSIIFAKEDDAMEMEKELLKGKDFNELSKKFLNINKAREGDKGTYLKARDIHPKVNEILSKMKVGSISPVIPLKSEFVILRLEDIRYPEDPEMKKKAREEALKNKRFDALKDYNQKLIKRYAKINHEVLESIDYESKVPGFESLLKDERVVAEIKGESPITVGELTRYIRQQLYHGIERAIENKKLNSKKIPSFEELLYKRVFRKEALRLGLDKTEKYKNRVKDYENSLLFGAFIKKVILPDIKIKEEEVKSYYQEHMEEYTYPEMMRINTLIFKKREDAEMAIEKLKRGTDFKWLSAHAEGQIDKETAGILNFDGRLLTTKDLPEGIRKAIVGVQSNDFRLYESPEGYFYVLAIKDVVTSRPIPYEEVKEIVSRKVFDNKVKMALEEYADKLKSISEIKIYYKEN